MKKYRLKKWYPSLDNDFEVGDMVYYNGLSNLYVRAQSPHYSIDVNEVENNPDFWELIEEEKPKPLFITEDGVECFDRDKYITIGYDFNKRNMRAYNCDAPYSNGVIRFKHESNADEYIWRNKPVFSYEDFIRWGNVPYQRIIEQFAKERVEE